MKRYEMRSRSRLSFNGFSLSPSLPSSSLSSSVPSESVFDQLAEGKSAEDSKGVFALGELGMFSSRGQKRS